MGNANRRETENPSLRGHRRGRRTTRLAALALAVIVLGVTIVGAFYWKSFSRTNQLPRGPISEKIVWRIRLFERKLTGGVPELSWSELWQMVRRRGGFGLEIFVQGVSLDGSVHNEYDSASDLQAASRIFS